MNEYPGLPVDFAAKGINVGINSNHTERSNGSNRTPPKKIINFPVLIDSETFTTRERTPRLRYSINEKNVLVYKGAIDNSRSGENITENFLRDAIEGI